MDCSTLGFPVLHYLWVFAQVAQSCLTLCDPMDSTLHGILQARILEWAAVAFSRGSSQPRNQTQVSRSAGRFFTSWATRKLWVHLNSYSLSWWCHPTISGCPLLLLPSVLTSIRVFSNESALYIRWPKYWSFSINILMNIQDWFPSGLTGLILQSKGLSRVFLQHHSSKASILQCSAFLMVQLSHPYMMTGKTKVLTIWTFVSKVTTGF